MTNQKVIVPICRHGLVLCNKSHGKTLHACMYIIMWTLGKHFRNAHSGPTFQKLYAQIACNPACQICAGACGCTFILFLIASFAIDRIMRHICQMQVGACSRILCMVRFSYFYYLLSFDGKLYCTVHHRFENYGAVQ